MFRLKDDIVIIPLDKLKFAALCLYPVVILCLGIWLVWYSLVLGLSLLSVLLFAGGIALCVLAMWLFVGVGGLINAATTGFYFTQEAVMFRDEGELCWPPSPPDSFRYGSIERFEVRNKNLTLYLHDRRIGDRVPNIDFAIYQVSEDELGSLLSQRIGKAKQNDVLSTKAIARLEE